MSSFEKKIKLIDLFSGAGGLSNGFEQTGRFQVVGAVENNQDAADTYIYNHDKNKDLLITSEGSSVSDITQVNFKQFLSIKKIDGKKTVVVGGPPCQGFSNANRQRNHLISGNNQLVKEYVRAIDEIRPMAFLMENVKTMNSTKHKFFVTKDSSSGIFAYSSEKHLLKISTYTEEKPFWNKDELILIRTDNVQLESLIRYLITCQKQEVLLSNGENLSRMRSIIRNLGKKELYNTKSPKEENEINAIIEDLEHYIIENTTGLEEMKEIILVAINVLRTFTKGINKNNQESLQALKPLVDINQLLRYLRELEEEHIYCLGTPMIDWEANGQIVVKVQVKSYSIVKYLEIFFKYLDYEVDADVMLASNFYTPQNRSRFMMLGINKKFIENKPVKLPKRDQSNGLSFNVFDAIGDLERIEPKIDVSDYELTYNPHEMERLPKMQAYFRKNAPDLKIYNHVNVDSSDLSRRRFQELKDTGGKNFHSLSKELREITYTDGTRTQNTVYLRLQYNKPSPTVLNVRKSMWQHPKNAVSLSIREAARLQTFKDDFIFKGTKDQQYQQVGNAVPPLLARAVAERLLHIIGESPVDKLSKEFDI